MSCPHCGKELPRAAKFCPECGSPASPPDQGRDSTPTSGDTEADELHSAAREHLLAVQSWGAITSVGGNAGKSKAEVALEGLKLVDAALRLQPNNATFLNTKAILYSDGLGRAKKALELLRMASALKAPPDISMLIKRNTEAIGRRSRFVRGMALSFVFGLAVGIGLDVLGLRAYPDEPHLTYCLIMTPLITIAISMSLFGIFDWLAGGLK